MARTLLMVFAFLFLWVGSTPLFAGQEAVDPYNNGHFQVEVGDTIYVSESGERGPFQTLSKKPGKCGFGQELVAAEVTGVSRGAANVMLNGREVQFSTVGKYICACPEECPCQAISQAPAPCPCNPDKDMQPVGIW